MPLIVQMQSCGPHTGGAQRTSHSDHIIWLTVRSGRSPLCAIKMIEHVIIVVSTLERWWWDVTTIVTPHPNNSRTLTFKYACGYHLNFSIYILVVSFNSRFVVTFLESDMSFLVEIPLPWKASDLKVEPDDTKPVNFAFDAYCRRQEKSWVDQFY